MLQKLKRDFIQFSACTHSYYIFFQYNVYLVDESCNDRFDLELNDFGNGSYKIDYAYFVNR